MTKRSMQRAKGARLDCHHHLLGEGNIVQKSSLP